MNYGYVQSVMDGTEHKFEMCDTKDLPKSYTYKPYLPQVLNQGRESICVPCSCSAYINWKMNINEGEISDHKVKLHDIYNIRPNKSSDGMSFKDALHFLRNTGVNTDGDVQKINEYALVTSADALKLALMMNGPCIGGLFVYNNGPRFWEQTRNSICYGGHAISIVGYNEEGFIIRNSWGNKWANDGYTVLPYKDFDKLLECWTIF